MGYRGVDVRQSGDRIIFRASLKDSSNAILSTGTTSLYIFELQSDGSLKSYDFNDNTFKSTALTTANIGMTHQTGNNATYSTGIWTYALTTVTGFTRGNVYFAQVVNTGATPAAQEREFQYGAGEGDMIVDVNGRVDLSTMLGDGTSVSALQALYSGGVIAGTVNVDTSTSDFTLTSTALLANDNEYNSMWLVFTSGNNKGVPRIIGAYTGATKRVQFTGGGMRGAFPETVTAGDSFLILAAAQ